MAVTKLFSSCKRSGAHMGDFESNVCCGENIPPRSQMQALPMFCVIAIFSRVSPTPSTTCGRVLHCLK
uniref:Uncharacterized protein n=1 Tax=Aegilops tauschii subsp. strangulata TaxID=200361 RepID=A0A453MRF1_AEGTS